VCDINTRVTWVTTGLPGYQVTRVHGRVPIYIYIVPISYII
jgi:hypothetical protein